MQLVYNESVIANKELSKYLGVIIDSKCNFKAFINNVESKIDKSVGILNRLRYLFPSTTLFLLYFSFIQPHLLYGLLAWESTSPSYLTNLQRLQNKALRIIFNSNSRASIILVYCKLRIIKISDMYNLELAKLMHQHSRNSLPSYFSTFFPKVSSIHNHSTRTHSQNTLYLPKFSTLRPQKLTKYQGTKIWNSIPINLRNQPFNKFKTIFKNQLLEDYNLNFWKAKT